MIATDLLGLARRRAELHPKMENHLQFLHASAAWFEALAASTADEIRESLAAGANESGTTRLYLRAAVAVLAEPDVSAVYAKAAACWREKIAEQP